jgi:hypothetical protein
VALTEKAIAAGITEADLDRLMACMLKGTLGNAFKRELLTQDDKQFVFNIFDKLEACDPWPPGHPVYDLNRELRALFEDKHGTEVPNGNRS